MSKRVYLNKREGCFKEFAVIAVILLVVVIALLLVAGLLFSEGDPEDEGVSRDTQSESLASQRRSVAKRRGPAEVDAFSFSAESMAEIWAAVVNSPHVRSNPQYATVLRNVVFRFDADNDEVNAYASRIERNQVRTPCVTLLGGSVRLDGLCGCALASDRAHVTTNALARLLEKLDRDGVSPMPAARAAGIARECGIPVEPSKVQDEALRRAAGKLAAGMVMGTLSHEAGHVAYGHVQDTGLSHANVEIERNQERDADSFCASVMTSSDYGACMLEGRMFYFWLLSRHDPKHATTHPLSKERLGNLIRANERLAKELGMESPDEGEAVK